MSVVEVPPRVAQPPADRDRRVDQSWRWMLTYEHVAYLALFALALLAHLWGLDNRALHHDETLHAFYSWQLFMGRGFIHDPLLHGPFLYHLGALIYFLFGDSDYTARLGVALFGSALVVMPYLIRRELGRGAALMAAVYLLISPSFLYVGRFIRHDMYAVTFEMLAFISIVRYASTRRARWLYIGAAALALMFTTMETFFLYVAIFGALFALVFLWRVWRPSIVLAAVIGAAVVALVFVLPGKPQQTIAGGDTVERAAGPYVCPSPGSPPSPANPILFTPGPIFGFEPLATADNNYALCARNEPDNSFSTYFVKLGQFFLHPAIVLAMAVSAAGAIALYVLLWRRRDRTGRTAWERARGVSDGLLDAFASLMWGRRALIALAVFATIYTLFFTAFLVNPVGVISGTTGSLLYWLSQHNVQRGGQPGYYYLVLLVIYEPLALIWSIVGLIMVGVLVGRRLLVNRRGEQANDVAADPPTNGRANGTSMYSSIGWDFAMPVMLAWWAIGTVALYSWAGEKMPWLLIHVALPLVLLGSWAFGRVLSWRRQAEAGALVVLARAAAGIEDDAVATDWSLSDEALRGGNGHPQTATDAPGESLWSTRPLPVYLGIFGTIAMLSFLLLSIVSKPDGQQQNIAALVPLLALVLVALLTLGSGLIRGWRWAIGALAIAVTLLGGVYSMRSAYQLSYRWGDVPREMLIYTQTSPDVARVIDQLEKASIRRGGSLAMPIWYDNETVWQWYLRRFTNKQQQGQSLSTPPGEDVQAVLMLQENLDSYPQNLQNLQGFRIQRYPLRWWFPEEQIYRLPPDWLSAPVNDSSPLLMRVLRNPTDGRNAAQLWQFLIYRQLPAPLGSTDFVIAVRPDLADEIGLGTGGPK